MAGRPRPGLARRYTWSVGRELELKYSSPDGVVPEADELAAALAPIGMVARPSGTRRQLDVYFDDAALRLERHGLALRLRTSDAGAVATVKGRGDAVQGVFEREELEVPLAASAGTRLGDQTVVFGASAAPAWPVAIAARLASLVSLPDLEPRLEIETTRVAFVLERPGSASNPGAPVAELAFDEVVCRPPSGRGDGALIDAALFSEVEIEAKGETTRDTLLAIGGALERLLPLVSGSASKLERAASLLAPFIE